MAIQLEPSTENITGPSESTDNSTVTGDITNQSTTIVNNQTVLAPAQPGLNPGTGAASPAETELTPETKRKAGILLVVCLIIPIAIIVACWPDRVLVGDKYVYRLDGTKSTELLLLVLVAAGGFLGNMIHIANSLTAYIGSGKFKRNWILWYSVTPFTASALALILYFAFQSSYVTDAGIVNLYGIMTMAGLAGLFTDITTKKLKDVLDVILSTKDDRGDKLTNSTTDKPAVKDIKITDANPKTLVKGKANTIVLTGQALTSKALAITIDGEDVVDPVVTDTNITFDYTISDETKTSFDLVVNDDADKTIYTTKLSA